MENTTPELLQKNVFRRMLLKNKKNNPKRGVGRSMNSSEHQKPKRKFNIAARTMLPILVAVKDRVRSRWSVLPYHREPEYVAVLGLADELVDAVIDDRDMADARAASLLGAIGAFINSTYLPEQPGPWEEA